MMCNNVPETTNASKYKSAKKKATGTLQKYQRQPLLKVL